ncbi:transglycosylase SLT domain-containing protein [Primorskyibacter flagellatus]|uniref:transglycosylase SLT domain-containing protein n=1 Tax=Primorskyibacter flagellatus TaxID=1387277 RepID=UPI0016674EBF|nr:transglycosylase SLT domain-containing protein [Primorskyibacter flagellatus]
MQVVLRRCGLVLGLGLALALGAPGSVVRATESPISQMEPRPLASALDAVRDGNWAKARALAERDGPVAESYVEWLRLRSGRGTGAEVLAFLETHGHWPGLDYLRQRNEDNLAAATHAEVIAFFRDHTPRTGPGALRYAEALENNGQTGEAEATVVLAWRTLDLDAAAHDRFRARYVDLLTPHHAARLSQAIWEDRDGDTQRMLDLVSAEQVTLAKARLGLQGNAANVNALIDAVPEKLRRDPGLAYDRFRWRVRKGLNDDAKQLLLEQSLIPGGLGFPDKWANNRRSYARDEMRNGNAELAYKLASTHQLTEGGNFADLEWLAGYVALRYLRQPEVALRHFNRLEEGVQTPISLGRAGYWRGRALEAMGEQARALEAYRKGGEQQTTFYGLLAAEKAGMPFDASLAGTEQGRPWQETTLARSDLREAVMLLHAAGQDFDAERFLKHMAETASDAELKSLGRMVEEAGDPHLEIMLGKEAAGRGIVIPRHYYALHPMAKMDLPVSMEMALAIARRESEFDPSVTSQVGARGLMQLMPPTAMAMARQVGDTDDVTGRLGYWAYNVKLGSAYLAKLAEDFGGNVMLVSVGYNAGPSRAVSWSGLFGDPRFETVDPVDWVEHIPFRETRNYVQRVAESLPIYRARLGRPPLPVPFSTELSGSTLATFPPKGE